MKTPLAIRILQRLLSDCDRDEVLGDLQEAYLRRRNESGTLWASLWLWRHTASVPLRIAADRLVAYHLRGDTDGRRPPSIGKFAAWTASVSVALDHLSRNVRFSCRSMRKRPLFFLIPVLSLSVGIGASTFVFSGANALLFQGMPGVPKANRIVEIWTGSNGSGLYEFNYPDFLDLREQTTALKEVAGYKYQLLTLSRGGAGERALGLLVSANYFRVLGVAALHGRTFVPEEDRVFEVHPVAVLSHSFWQSHWGADPGVLGSTIYVSRQPYTVVGITPQDFQSHSRLGNPDVYIPFTQYRSLNPAGNSFENRGATWFQVLALLAPGRTVGDANAEVATVFERLSAAYPETNSRRTARVAAFGALPTPARGYVGLLVAVLMGFAVLLLLITCTNVAGMFLARAVARQKETAVQLALGSSRGQLLLQLLTESLIVFFAGAVGGAALAVWTLRYLSSFVLPAPFPVNIDISPNVGALLFAVVLAFLAGLISGLFPARSSLGLNLASTLKSEVAQPRSAEGRLRRGFVAAQLAASLVLLSCAGLLLRALHHSSQIDKGFDASETYVTFLDLTTEGYTREEGSVFQDNILDYFSAMPWVESVALATDLPLDMSSDGTAVVPEGWESTSDREYMPTRYNAVSPLYFSTLRIRLLEGRYLDDDDRKGSAQVAVVSRRFARQVWPGESAVGRTLRAPHEITVVGVVEDVPNQLITETRRPLLYRPLEQEYRDELSLVIRSSADPALISAGTHEALRALDPKVSLSPVITLQRFNAIGTLPQRLAGTVASGLGFVALLLSAMGVYGVVASSVAQRRREMGIRMALGAKSGRVLLTVMAATLRFTITGAIAGALLALAGGMALKSLLLGVSPRDPVALLGATAAVGLMVVAGTLIPARRAASTDPAEALRHD